ncbi:MAG: acyl-[acyl-carrier-protein]--UDP-N-acetylglucosamine O-acyltransferase, partial [Acetobacteraceae bacterium]
ARMIGLNLIGLKRRGFSRPQIHALRGAFRLLFKEPGVFSERLEEAERRWADDAQVGEILAFIKAPSKRGLCKAGRDLDADDADDEA